MADMRAQSPPSLQSGGLALTAPLQLENIEVRAASAEGSQRSVAVSTVPAAAMTTELARYELTDGEVTSLAIAQGDAAALAAEAPFPMRGSLLTHLQQENKWQREQLRELQKQVEKSENAAVTSLRSSEKRSRELLRQLREEQERREAAESTASAAASRVKDMHEEVAKYKVQAEGAIESERQMAEELGRTREEAATAWKRASDARESQTKAELMRRYAEEEMKRLRVDMHGLEARSAMMRGRLDDIDAAKMLLHEQGMRNAAATVIASGWRGKADRKLAFRALEIKSATLMQSHWRRYTARAELRARLRMMRRERQITQLAMAAGMLEQGRAHVLALREKMAQEQKEVELQELEEAKEALQGWDGKVVVTIAIPAFLVGEDEPLGSFKCFPGKRLVDIRETVEEEIEEAPDDWVFQLDGQWILDSFDEGDHTVEEYIGTEKNPNDNVMDRNVMIYVQERLIADPPPVIEDKPIEEEPIEEEPPYGIEHEAAAIRIQSRFRGRQARKWKREQDETAAKIQCRFRGNRTRRNLPAKVVEESDDDDSLDDLEQMIYRQLGKKLAKDALTKPGDGPGEDKKVIGPTAVDREMDGSGIGCKKGIVVTLQERIAEAKEQSKKNAEQLKVNLGGGQTVAAQTKANAATMLADNHKKLKDDADTSLTELKEANEEARGKANGHYDELTRQVKQIHAVLATLAIGMSEHNQLMAILDAIEANAMTGLSDSKSGHNGLMGLLEDSHRRVCKNEQNYHDDLQDASHRMHDEMLEKIELLNTHGISINEMYRGGMDQTLKAELGLMQKTVEQMRIRGHGLDSDLFDTNAALDATKHDLMKMTGKATTLDQHFGSSKQEVKRLSDEVVKQAEKEAALVEANVDLEHRRKSLQGSLSSAAQALHVQRIRATEATMAVSQSALLKGQLTAVLELLRMRREVHHGTLTSLAPPTAREIMEHVNYLIGHGLPYPMGLEMLYKAEELRFGGDIQGGTLQLKSRVKTVTTAGGSRLTFEMAVVANLEDAVEEFLPSPFTIEPWATTFVINQGLDRSNAKLPIEMPAEFEPVYYLDGDDVSFEKYSARLRSESVSDEPLDAYVVAKVASGTIEATEDNLSFQFRTERELLFIDPLVGSDHNPGSESYPFQTVLKAAQEAAKPEVVKEVRVLLRDQAADTVVLTLPAIIIAVIAEEAMHAPLPDGWERTIDKKGNTFYHNKWLAGRKPSYMHPMDVKFRYLCKEMMDLEKIVAQEFRDHQTHLDELPEFPTAVVIEKSVDPVTDLASEEVREVKYTKGGSLRQFLDEAALGKYYDAIVDEGAAIPEDLREVDNGVVDEEGRDALDRIGMLRLEKLRFKRVVDTAFPEVIQKEEAQETQPEELAQLEYRPHIEEVMVDRQITIVGAKGLRKTDMMGKSDPYAVLYLNDEKVGQTEFQSKTIDPTWEAEYQVQIPQTYHDGVLQVVPGHRGATVRIEVFDHDYSLSHDFLGQVELHSVEYSDDLTMPMQTSDLQGKGRKQGKVTGELTFALQDPATVLPTVKRQLVVAGATNLRAADRAVFGEGSSDAYAVVYWNDVEIARTDVDEQTVNPIWETRVMLTIPDRGGVLRVELFDHDLTDSDDFLGQVEEPIGGADCILQWDPEEMELDQTGFKLVQKPADQGQASQVHVQGKLQLRIENPEMRKLVVMEAMGLRAADKMTSDPFAMVYWNDRLVGQTKVAEKTLDPKWEDNELGSDFELAIDPRIGSGTLRIEVYDFDEGSKSDFLGQIEMPVGGDDYGGQGIVMDRRAFPLQPDPRKPTDRIPGALVLRIEDPAGKITPALQELEGLARPPTPHGNLEVTVIEAKDLKKMDTFGRNDPYVVVTVEGLTRRTSTIDGGGAKPVWGEKGSGEKLLFEVAQAFSVEVAIFDEDADADDHIGTAIVELDNQPETGDWLHDEWYEIADGKGKTTGEVHVHINWEMPRDRALQTTAEFDATDYS